jgi:bacillithiol system protein YtxJ
VVTDAKSVNRQGGNVIALTIHGAAVADLRARIDWTALTDEAQLDAIDRLSAERPVLIFKHSTRCSISSAALNRLESAWSAADAIPGTLYYLDLIRFRGISNAIADRYGVQHESPQVLVIHHGRCVHHASHFGITYAGSREALHAAGLPKESTEA